MPHAVEQQPKPLTTTKPVSRSLPVSSSHNTEQIRHQTPSFLVGDWLQQQPNLQGPLLRAVTSCPLFSQLCTQLWTAARPGRQGAPGTDAYSAMYQEEHHCRCSNRIQVELAHCHGNQFLLWFISVSPVDGFDNTMQICTQTCLLQASSCSKWQKAGREVPLHWNCSTIKHLS